MKFKVGDVCEGKNMSEQLEYNGMECVVIEDRGIRKAVGAITGMIYPPAHLWRVKWADGWISSQSADELRLKRPPSWDKWIFDTSDVDHEQPVSA